MDPAITHRLATDHIAYLRREANADRLVAGRGPRPPARVRMIIARAWSTARPAPLRVPPSTWQELDGSL
jgi:hypothetical protein